MTTPEPVTWSERVQQPTTLGLSPADATRHILSLARDMQDTHTSEVRRQGRRLEAALCDLLDADALAAEVESHLKTVNPEYQDSFRIGFVQGRLRELHRTARAK